MTTTANLGLNLPEGSDYADIVVLTANFQKLDSVVSAARSAEEYDPAATYAVGAYRTKDGKLYKCTTPITAAEAWTAAHWTETTIGAELAAAYSALEAHTENTSNPHGVTPAQIGAATTTTLTATIPVSWTASGSFYYQQVSVAGMLATDNPVADILPGSDNAANKLYAEAWAKVQSFETMNGAVKFWCTAAPTTAFPVHFKVVR